MAKLDSVVRKTKGGLSVTLCSPVPGDGEELLAAVKIIMANSLHLLTTAEEFKVTIEREEQMIQDCLDNPGKIIIVPKVDGNIVGMMDFTAGHRARIAHQGEFGMSLLPEFRGKGIGRLMIEELVRWASAHQTIETLRLRVHAKNVEAVALYRSMKFRTEGVEIKGVKLGTSIYDDVISMALDVKA